MENSWQMYKLWEQWPNCIMWQAWSHGITIYFRKVYGEQESYTNTKTQRGKFYLVTVSIVWTLRNAKIGHKIHARNPSHPCTELDPFLLSHVSENTTRRARRWHRMPLEGCGKQARLNSYIIMLTVSSWWKFQVVKPFQFSFIFTTPRDKNCLLMLLF